jgi:hypothetical protein
MEPPLFITAGKPNRDEARAWTTSNASCMKTRSSSSSKGECTPGFYATAAEALAPGQQS